MSKLAILCSGQGAQTPDLFERFPFTEKGLQLRQRILEAGSLSPEIAAWLSNPSTSPQDIYDNHFSQPLLALFQVMVWAELEGLLPAPDLIAGYSLGELSAYACSGALSPEVVVRLAGTRARLMDEASPHGALLAVTGLSPEKASTAAALAGGYLAIVIGEDHCVLGSLATQVDALIQAAHVAGAREVTMLAVSIASHTPLLDAAVEPFRTSLQEAAWSEPRTPLLAGINATKVIRREQMLDWLPEQIHRTIRWDHCLQRLSESGCRILLELGPGKQLSHMGLACGLEARSVEEFRSVEGIVAWVEKSLQG
jgi:[acyl-carrier-protein] S-malonyltransferase